MQEADNNTGNDQKASLAAEVMHRHGFTLQRKQPGLDDFFLVSYVKGGVTVQIDEWPDGDWEIRMAYGRGEALTAFRTELLELVRKTPARRERIPLLIDPPE